jgi:hypothetical protein
MATVMNPQSRHHTNIANHTTIQKVCIGMGVGFILVGLAGIMMPGFMGMHLSLTHDFIHLGSGALALWAGYSDDSRKAYRFSVAFGTLYGLLGIGGFLLGSPGYPGVGNMEADQNLLRVIPNVLELGTVDHLVHIIIAAAFLLGAFSWKRNEKGTRGIVDHQSRRGTFSHKTTRPDAPNGRTDLSNADLGKSDVNRTSDMNRRADFQRKL